MVVDARTATIARRICGIICVSFLIHDDQRRDRRARRKIYWLCGLSELRADRRAPSSCDAVSTSCRQRTGREYAGLDRIESDSNALTMLTTSAPKKAAQKPLT